MAIFVTEQQVQQWLNTTKLLISAVDEEHDATAQQIVFATISTQYDTTTWVDGASTPQLIRRIMSMFEAAWHFMRAAEGQMELDDSVWGVRLENMAYNLLNQVAAGTLTIPGADANDSTVGQISFYPTDLENDTDAEAKFSMGTTF